MLLTSHRVDWDIRLGILEEFIKTLVNSGHRFPYIKAVVLQGISKYQYMIERDRLEPYDKKYMPLYRDKTFRKNERMLIKYVNGMVWHKDSDLGDPFRKGWKARINRSRWNDRKKPAVSSVPPPDKTTTIFVPNSRNSELFENIVRVEREVQQKVKWGVKVIEQPGSSLLHCFTSKFPIIAGCPRGSRCCICKNNGIGCTVKSVVYSAECKLCCHDGGNIDDKTKFNATYIGETCRPWRERILEHQENANNWRSCSFIIEHWMKAHPVDTKPPEFKFKILENYPDALRRQLSEAIHILESGGLNKRMEFNANFLCRLEPRKTPKEMENDARIKLSEKKLFVEKIENFINVMYNVSKCQVNHHVSNQINTTSRSNKRGTSSSTSECAPKQARMEASTPRSDFRNKQETESPCSPIQSPGSERDSLTSGGTEFSDRKKSSTKLSFGMDQAEISRARSANSSQESRDFAQLTQNWHYAAVDAGVNRRSSSLPPYIDRIKLEDNWYFKYGPYMRADSPNKTPYARRANSMGDISLSPWNDKEAFLKFKEEKDLNERMDNLKISHMDSERKFVLRLGLNADASILNSPGTSNGKAMKRILQVSPTTPHNYTRKFSLCCDEGGSPTLRTAVKIYNNFGSGSGEVVMNNREISESTSDLDVDTDKIYRDCSRGGVLKPAQEVAGGSFSDEIYWDHSRGGVLRPAKEVADGCFSEPRDSKTPSGKVVDGQIYKDRSWGGILRPAARNVGDNILAPVSSKRGKRSRRKSFSVLETSGQQNIRKFLIDGKLVARGRSTSVNAENDVNFGQICGSADGSGEQAIGPQ